MAQKITLVCLLLASVLAEVYLTPIIDPVLYRSLQSKSQLSANVLLSMSTGSPSEALNSLKNVHFNNRNDRLNSVARVLKDVADASQTDLLTFLKLEASDDVVIRQLWIINKISVRGADFSLIQKLLKRNDISQIQQEKMIPYGKTIDETNQPLAGEQWGVITIEAPEVWQSGINGSGVVVSTIDSGVRGTHEALVGNHRKEYGWFNPEGMTNVATDEFGHGTHTMGTICGTTKGIGVAPGAQWVACKPCEADWCSESYFFECGQWILCPTDSEGNNADCSKAPHLVSNSWGDDSFEYDGVIDAWNAGGIIGLFSSGNSGPTCSSLGYPGTHAEVITVGSTTSADALSSFSSVGPTDDDRIKPDISAPGSSVYSSCATGDRLYCTKSGTSMACPHAAGLVALLFSQDPNLTYDRVKTLVQGGAVPIKSTGRDCGGIDETVYPNNHAGHGRIDAKNSVDSLLGR